MVADFLQTEYWTNPIGLDAVAPLFTWKRSDGSSERQTGCRVRVWTDAEETIWDSGYVPTERYQLRYAGPTLHSRETYHWAVCLYGGKQQGPWSETASFEMGLLSADDWKARWIGIPTSDNYVVLCRHVKNLEKPVAKARAYLAAEGFAQLWINGHRVCQDVLDPANTDYEKRILYRTFDITGLLTQGPQAFGIRLSRGWVARGKCLLQIHLDYEDNTSEIVCTRPGEWKIALSPIRYATIYGGEYYDGRMECDNWNDPSDRFEQEHTKKTWGFFEYIEDAERPDQRWWFPAVEMPAPAGALQAQNVEPIRNIGEIAPERIYTAPDGSQVVDFGQNIAGWVRISMHGQRSDAVTLAHSELLNEDGTLNMDYLTSAAPNYPLPMQTDTYIFGDDRSVVYEPQFTYHGFRYVAVKGLRYPLEKGDIMAVIGCSAVEEHGRFACGNELMSKIYRASVWSEKTNMHGIPTDCPQRAERHGWLNDLTVRAEAAVYQFDVRRFYRKFIEDIRMAQDPISGAIPDVAPFRHGNFPGDPVDCYLLLPYLLYWHYADAVPLEQCYSSMKKLTQYWDRNIIDGILPISLYGDWASPERYCRVVWDKVTPISVITSGTFVSTCFHYYSLTLMEEFAAILGKNQERDEFRQRAAQMQANILEQFYDSATGNFAGGSQGENALALYMKLVPQGQEALTLQRLVEDIKAKDCHLSTGNLCTKYLVEVLSEYGHIDLAYTIATQTDYPSWGYMIENGATTIWERWEYKTGVDMNSHNHAMYGSIITWMYKYLAGISPLEPGFRRTAICPYIPQKLPAAGAAMDTAFGTVSCFWKQTEDRVVTDIEIPVGMEAVISLPFFRPYRDGDLVQDAAFRNGRWEIICGHGKYSFVSPKA